jgi:hypothetical protein
VSTISEILKITKRNEGNTLAVYTDLECTKPSCTKYMFLLDDP